MVDGGGFVLLDGYNRYIYVLLFRVEDFTTILTYLNTRLYVLDCDVAYSSCKYNWR